MPGKSKTDAMENSPSCWQNWHLVAVFSGEEGKTLYPPHGQRRMKEETTNFYRLAPHKSPHSMERVEVEKQFSEPLL